MTRIGDTFIDVEAALAELGIEAAGESREGWVSALCPFHPETSPSFAVNIEHGGWVCWHTGRSGSLVQLAQHIQGGSSYKAIGWLRGQRPALSAAAKLLKRLQPGVHATKLEEWATEYERLDPDKMAKYYFDRGFTVATMQLFEVRYDPETPALMWPVRDENFNLVGFVKRKLPGCSEPKYLYNDGFRRVLYPLHLFRGTRAILTEGPLDAMWLHQAGEFGGLTIFGSRLSADQELSLRRLVRVIVLAADNDEVGRAMEQQLGERLSRLFTVLVARYAAKDLQELPENKVLEAVATARSWVLERSNIR